MTANKELYKWKRQTNPLDVARGNKKKDPLAQWRKKVQNASEIAAKEAFGGDILGKTDFEDIIPDDEAMYEAQTLLDGWLHEKAFPDLTNEVDFGAENWNKSTPIMLDSDSHFRRSESPVESARNWLDGMLLESSNKSPDTVDVRNEYANEYLKLQDYDDDEDICNQLLVNEVLHGMLNKDIANGIDLGMKPLVKQVKDPLPKMNLRHQQVKTKSQARRKRDMENKKVIQTREEIQKKAQERIIQEEKGKVQRQEQEERAIQQEMFKIREELQEEKRKREEEMERKAKILEEAKTEIQRELQKQKEEEQQRRLQKRKTIELNKMKKEKQKQELTIMEMRTKMQTLHRHFAAWYNVVLARRISLGKARAICDWKCKLKAWNAWKAYVSHVKSNQEAMAIEEKMKENYRKEQMAITHFHYKMLKLCLHSWRRYTRHKMDKKLLKLEHENKTKKMAIFLEAASKGFVWNENNGDANNGGEFSAADKRQIKSSKRIVVAEETRTHIKQSVESSNVKKGRPRSNSLLRDDGSKNRQSSNVIDLKNKQKKVENVNSNSIANYTSERSDTKDSHRKNTLEDRLVTVYDFVDDEPSHRSIDNQSQRSKESLMKETNKLQTPRIRSDKPITKPLHLAMEERALQRKERRDHIEAEKRRREDERLKELREKQEERLRNEELEKHERVKKKQEEKKREAMKEQQRLERLAAMHEKTALSTYHYEKHLLKKYGLEPLKRFLQIARLNKQVSERFCNTLLLKKTFKEWNQQTKEIVHEKQQRADTKFYELLLRRSFRSWKKCRFHLQMLNKLARSHSIARIKKRAFRAWQDYVTDERILMWAKENDAEEHDVVRMRKKYFNTWRRFIQSEKEERVREKRRELLRKKVQIWLPDFQVA